MLPALWACFSLFDFPSAPRVECDVERGGFYRTRWGKEAESRTNSWSYCCSCRSPALGRCNCARRRSCSSGICCSTVSFVPTSQNSHSSFVASRNAAPALKYCCLSAISAVQLYSMWGNYLWISRKGSYLLTSDWLLLRLPPMFQSRNAWIRQMSLKGMCDLKAIFLRQSITVEPQMWCWSFFVSEVWLTTCSTSVLDVFIISLGLSFMSLCSIN